MLPPILPPRARRRPRAQATPRHAPGIEPLEPRVLLSLFTVTAASDSGAGSLRDAIEAANNQAGADTIEFDIAGSGVHTIALDNPLPDITDALAINGYSQPGASVNTSPDTDNAVLLIELNGAGAGGGAQGLTLDADGCAVSGLVINRFGVNGILVKNGADGCTIAGNFIGVDPGGTLDRGNGSSGVVLAGGSNHTVGGDTPAARNVIADNDGRGIRVFGGTGNRLAGNLIFGNTGVGIDLDNDGATANDPGDADTGANNLQNYPVLTAAEAGTGQLTVSGALNSAASQTFTLEFFANTGSGREGARFLGSSTATTNAGGTVDFSENLAVSVPTNQFVTATATDGNGNTSEFSAAQAVSQAPDPTPNLTAALNPAPLSVQQGGSASVTVNVANPGDASVSTDFTVRVYASTNGTLDAGDTRIGSATFTDTLASGANQDIGVQLNVPSDFATGSYTLIAVVDEPNVVAESDETDNTDASAAGVLTVTAAPTPTPDLTASFDPPSASVQQGGSTGVTVTVGNAGDAAVTTDFVLRVYASTNGTFDGSDTLLGSSTVTATVAAGGSVDTPVTLNVPDDFATGSYTLIAVVDASGVVSESNESNNTDASAAGALTVTAAPTPQPNLTATFDPASLSVARGDSANLTVAVNNTGDAAVTTDFVVRVFASADGTFDGADTQIGTTTVTAAVPAGGATDAAVTVTIPSNFATGDYTLFAVVDATGAVAESNESDNRTRSDLGVLTVTGAPTPQPDLVPAFDPAPLTIRQSDSDTVTVVVNNTGDATVTADYSVQVYASTDGTFSAGSDTLLGTQMATASVAAGGSSNVVVTVTVPAGLAAGSYTLFAVVDGGNAVAESDETNNRARSDLNVLTVTAAATPQPDLAPSFDPAPLTIQQGQSDTVTVGVNNAGDATVTADYTVLVYASSDGTFNAGTDTLIGTETATASVPAGGSSSVVVTLTVPSGLAAGSYTLFAVVDGGNAVAESDETNNRARSDLDALTVTAPATPRPDLVPSFDPAPLTIRQGESDTATVVVNNTGDATVTADYTVQVYASTDGTFSAGSDTLLGTQTATASVAAGGSSNVVVTLTVPSNLAAGEYTLFAVVDGGNAVAESDETNNRARSDLNVLTVTAAPNPRGDLSPTFDPPAASVQPGGSTGVTVNVANLGDATVTADFIVRVFASTDGTLSGSDTALGSATVTQSLIAGADTDVTVTLDVPGSFAPGSYTLIAAVDPADSVNESNENNNQAVSDTGVLTVASDAAPDLTGAFDVSPVSVDPGGSTPVSVVVNNRGDAAATEDFVIRVFASTDGVFNAGTDTLVGAADVTGPLAAGASANVPVSVIVPASLAPGTYTLFAVLDADSAVAESDEGNNTPASAAGVLTVTDVSRPGTDFGRDSASGVRRVKLRDVDGTRFTVTLKGPGLGTIFGETGDATFGLSLTGTTEASSVVITTDDGGDGEIDLDRISVGDSLRAFTAPTADLQGDVNIGGTLASLRLDDVGGAQHDLHIGGAGAIDRSRVAIRFDEVSDLSIDTAIGIASLRVSRWTENLGDGASDTITAPWIISLVSVGDFEPGLTLSGVNAPNTRALRTAKIGGGLTDAAWSAADGRIGSIVVAGPVSDFGLNVAQGDVKSLDLGPVADATVATPQGAVLGVTADEWLAGSISAQWVKSVAITGDALTGVRGDFGGDITSTDPNARLNRLAVAGLMDGVDARITGNLGNVSAGAIRGSNLFAGIDAAAPLGSLPTAAQIGDKTITRFRITGVADDFTDDLGGTFLFRDSNIAATAIHEIEVFNVDLNTGDDDFGFASARVEAYRRNTVRIDRRDLQAPADYDSALGKYTLRIVG